MPETPIGHALLVCDSIITDQHTQKKTLVGLFNQIISHTFPVRHPSMAIFASMSNGMGEVPCELAIGKYDGPDFHSYVSANGNIRFKDPMQVVEIGFILQNVVFPEPGNYCIRLLANQELVNERRFSVVEPAE